MARGHRRDPLHPRPCVCTGLCQHRRRGPGGVVLQCRRRPIKLQRIGTLNFEPERQLRLARWYSERLYNT